MEALRLVLLYAHLIGFAVLLGGSVAQYASGRIRINAPMLWSAPLRNGHEPSPVKLLVKALIGIMIWVMVFFSRKRTEVNRGHFLAIVGLTLVNAAVAVFWR
jgi:hypothetical protein